MIQLRPILERKGETKYVLDAVLGIGGALMLIFLGVKLYNFFISQEEKNAGAFLDGLQAKIEAMDDECFNYPQASPPGLLFAPPTTPIDCSVNNTFILNGFSNDWVLAGWNLNDKLADETTEGKPQKCFDMACLCLCKDDDSNCQEEGICRRIDRENIDVYSRLTFDVDEFGSSYNEGYIEADCIFLQKKLLGIFVFKNQTSLDVRYNYGLFKNPKEIDFLFNRLKLCRGYIYKDNPINSIPTISG